ncbi:MAG: ABC transporter permease, partial [Deltaproteobacteria bacterium]|nr:ABC transporter permease [Deltaproteobacteria bacterium]
MPLNAPFVSAEETSVSLRAVVKKIAGKEDMGRFNLKTSQSAPYNIFISGKELNRLMNFEGRANNILINTGLDNEDIRQTVSRCLAPDDAGLRIKQIDEPGETEISTERVFMEPAISRTIGQLPDAKPLITYFVNSIVLKGEGVNVNDENEQHVVPYSFVSSIDEKWLADDEIILTRWTADDLDAAPGDKVVLKYYEIGPLRQLTEKEAEFRVREVVSMSADWADSTRMPWIPGLSDAGHCRECEAGVPINLDAIRDKDEEYWNRWKGAPKAYISLNKAREMWENRFGIYTAVRFPSSKFNIKKINAVFEENIQPGDLGIIIEPVREQGISASRNGTDFSGLFLGLSFFILAASIILTALLFRLNLETRSGEVGILTALGFKENQVRGIFMREGFVVAVAGGIAGLLLSLVYTWCVFRILNTLWFEIVRTNVLLIKIVPLTLMTGLLISLVISMAAIAVSLFRYQRRKTADLQKRIETEVTKTWRQVPDGLIWLLTGVPLILIIRQFIRPEGLSPVLFFISGALLLSGLLLIYRKIIIRTGLG